MVVIYGTITRNKLIVLIACVLATTMLTEFCNSIPRFMSANQWRAVRLLVGEAQFFFTQMFAKKLFTTINDKQIIVFIAIKPGLPNPWPLGHIWPAKLFCVARKVVLRG